MFELQKISVILYLGTYTNVVLGVYEEFLNIYSVDTEGQLYLIFWPFLFLLIVPFS